jgi:hypothetical protein
MPVFTEGEESLLFLWKHPTGKNLVTGALHGKRMIIEDKISGKKFIKGRKVRSKEEEDHDHKESIKKVSLGDYINEIKGYIRK